MVLAEYKTLISEEAYARLLKLTIHFYTYFGGYITQFIDELTISYIKMADRETRLKNLPDLVNQMVDRSGNYRMVFMKIRQALALHQVSVSQIQFDDESYPQTIDW